MKTTPLLFAVLLLASCKGARTGQDVSPASPADNSGDAASGFFVKLGIPDYPNTNSDKAGDSQSGVTTLRFTSKDSIDKVADFYSKQTGLEKQMAGGWIKLEGKLKAQYVTIDVNQSQQTPGLSGVSITAKPAH